MAGESVHPFLKLIRERVSVESFDPARGLDESEIRELVADAIQAPSSFNIQHWRFVAVRDREDKQRLRQAAYGQNQVVEAAVTFIILGDLCGVEKLPAIMDRSVAEGALAEGRAAAWLRMANEIYADERMARDEALRSGSLVSMMLMLAAEARGLASGALSGFDAEQVRREFNIAPRYLPVMLLAVGYPVATDDSPKPRLSVDEVLAFDRGRIF